MRPLLLLLALAGPAAAADHAPPSLAELARDGFSTVLLTPTPEGTDGLKSAAAAILKKPSLETADTQNLAMLVDELIDLYSVAWNDRQRLEQEAKDRQKATELLIAQKDKQIEELNKEVMGRQDELKRELKRIADLEAQMQKEREDRAAGK